MAPRPRCDAARRAPAPSSCFEAHSRSRSTRISATGARTAVHTWTQVLRPAVLLHRATMLRRRKSVVSRRCSPLVARSLNAPRTIRTRSRLPAPHDLTRSALPVSARYRSGELHPPCHELGWPSDRGGAVPSHGVRKSTRLGPAARELIRIPSISESAQRTLREQPGSSVRLSAADR